MTIFPMKLNRLMNVMDNDMQPGQKPDVVDVILRLFELELRLASNVTHPVVTCC